MKTKIENKRMAAVAWLRGYLEERGGTAFSNDIYSDAKVAGHAAATLTMGRKLLSIRCHKNGYGDGLWYWELQEINQKGITI